MLQDQSRNRTPMPAAQPPAGVTPPEARPAHAEAGIARMLSPPPHGDQPPSDLVEACDWAVRHALNATARLIAFLDDLDGDADAEDDGLAEPTLAALIAGDAQIRWAGLKGEAA